MCKELNSVALREGLIAFICKRHQDYTEEVVQYSSIQSLTRVSQPLCCATNQEYILHYLIWFYPIRMNAAVSGSQLKNLLSCRAAQYITSVTITVSIFKELFELLCYSITSDRHVKERSQSKNNPIASHSNFTSLRINTLGLKLELPRRSMHIVY